MHLTFLFCEELIFFFFRREYLKNYYGVTLGTANQKVF